MLGGASLGKKKEIEGCIGDTVADTMQVSFVMCAWGYSSACLEYVGVSWALVC